MSIYLLLSTFKLLSTFNSQLSTVLHHQPVCFGRNRGVGLEEAVEERHVVEAQRQRYLLHLQIGQLELGLGVGDDGLNDQVAGCLVAHLLDGGAQVRQRDVHRLGVLRHMMPLVVVLEHEVAVLVVYLVLAVLRTKGRLRLGAEETVERHLEDVIHVHHLLRVQQRRRAVGCLYQQLACADHQSGLLRGQRHDGRMHVHGVHRQARLERVLLHERRTEQHIIDQRVLRELMDQQERTRLKQQGVVLMKIVLRNVDGRLGAAAGKDSKHRALYLAREATVFVHNLAAGIADKVVFRAVKQWDCVVFLHIRGVCCLKGWIMFVRRSLRGHLENAGTKIVKSFLF